MKKLLAMLGALMMFIAVVGCSEKGDGDVLASVEATDTTIEIVVEQLEGEMTLLEVMQTLQEQGEFTFTTDATGMIISINGKENASDWSKYWALYISDTELSEVAYGIEWKGQQLGFSNFGANSLPAEEGGVYVWKYFGA